MTQNKDLKRVIRARMKKTGEAYTTARAQVTRKSRAKGAPSAQPNYGELAGMTVREEAQREEHPGPRRAAEWTGIKSDLHSGSYDHDSWS